MMYIKTQKMQDIFIKLGKAFKYNPSKHIQYCFIFSNKTAYIENLKAQWLDFGKEVLYFVLIPFFLLYTFYKAVTSLFNYSLVITKKSLLKNNDYRDTVFPKAPKECYEQYGQDLDGCSTQEEHGCKGCILFK